MKVLIVGGGGREHAIALKIKENPEVTALYAAPGNGGIAQIATCLPFKATDVDGIVRWAAENKVDFVIVAPDDPLCLGMVDALAEQGIPAFGPRKNAAIIEGSKVFSKNLMKKYGIPTAAYETFDDYDAAVKYLQTADMPIVVKADGLALGKGVLICPDRESAVEAVASMMKEAKFGASGARVVIEEFLTGPEVSVLAFTDGKTVKPMVSSMDHKRALDHDEGLNTGGMGTIAPNPCYTPELAQRCMDEIFLPTIAAMNAEGRTFTGCLYFGLMMTPKGPKVIEYNCRFGDPETQVVLPLLKSDLLDDCRVYDYETGETAAVYDMTKLDSRDLYDVYLSGARSLLTIENPNAATDRELIVFRDSFGSSLVPLLVNDYARVTLVDLRYIRSNYLGQFLDFHGQDVLFLYSTLLLNNSATIK